MSLSIRGHASRNARFTPEQVKRIYLRKGTCTSTVLSKEIGVPVPTILDIWARKTYRSVTESLQAVSSE